MTAVANARTWTDITGKKLEADFVRVTNDDKLVLQSVDQEFIVPLNRFIAEDQEHVKKLLLIKVTPLPSGNSLPSKTLPGRKPTKRSLTEKRIWTDEDGLSITAKFLRIHEERVVLMQGSKAVPVEFYKLSEADQEFLHKQLDALGRSAEIPDKTSSSGGTSSSSGSSSPPVTSSTRLSPPPSIPSFRPPSYSSRPPFSGYRPPTVTYTPRSTTGSSSTGRTYTPPSNSVSGVTGSSSSPNSNQSFSSNNNQLARNTPPSYNPQFSRPKPHRFDPPKFELENVRLCSKCNGELPSHVSAGDNCPHCNVYFAKPGESRNRTSSSSSSDSSSGWDTSDIQISGRAIKALVFIAVTVIAGFVGFCRWLFHQN